MRHDDDDDDDDSMGRLECCSGLIEWTHNRTERGRGGVGVMGLQSQRPFRRRQPLNTGTAMRNRGMKRVGTEGEACVSVYEMNFWCNNKAEVWRHETFSGLPFSWPSRREILTCKKTQTSTLEGTCSEPKRPTAHAKTRPDRKGREGERAKERNRVESGRIDDRDRKKHISFQPQRI